MADRIFDVDPILHEEAELERKRHQQENVTCDDFWAYMPTHNYIFAPTRELWPAASVNARVGQIKLIDKHREPLLGDDGKPKTISAAAWLDRNKSVEQMAWAPGLPMIIRDRMLLEGGWSERQGISCFNLYQPPRIKPGIATEAKPWLDHLQYLYPEPAEYEHILDWLAHRVQRPHEKVNHALLLGGGPGIGKDTILVPVREAVGAWNFREASPTQILGRFNHFLKAVILRVNEARDLGDFDRIALYDRMKAYLAAPPETLTVDEKFLREYVILNCVGVIITTNHKADCLYLPGDDRRHFVVWSDRIKEDLPSGHWKALYDYYQSGGIEAVAAYLMARDIRDFDPKAPPSRTAAFWAIADNYRPIEENELADLLDLIGRPQAFTLATLIHLAEQQTTTIEFDFIDWLKDRRNRRTIPHRFDKCGYVQVRNPDAEDGLWRIKHKRQTVYARKTMPQQDQMVAARNLIGH